MRLRARISVTASLRYVVRCCVSHTRAAEACNERYNKRKPQNSRELISRAHWTSPVAWGGAPHHKADLGREQALCPDKTVQKRVVVKQGRVFTVTESCSVCQMCNLAASSAVCWRENLTPRRHRAASVLKRNRVQMGHPVRASTRGVLPLSRPCTAHCAQPSASRFA